MTVKGLQSELLLSMLVSSKTMAESGRHATTAA